MTARVVTMPAWWPPANRRRLLALTAWTVLPIVMLVLCAVAVQTGRLATLDRDVAGAVGAHTAHGLDVALSLLALLAGGALTMLWLLLLGAGAVRRAALRPLAVSLLVALLLADLVELMLKDALHHPPPLRARTVSFLFLGGPEVATSGSFPSGHAMRAVLLGVTLALLPRALGWRGRRAVLAVVAAVLLVAAITWTRVYLAEHWASDVLGGLLLGGAAVPALVGAAALAQRRPGARR